MAGDGRWRMEDGRWRGSRWRVANDGRRAAYAPRSLLRVACAPADHLLDLAKFASAADEQENEAAVVGHLPGRREQRVERVTRAVIAGVHHDELVRDPVRRAKSRASGGVEPDGLVVRPRGKDGDFFRRDPLPLAAPPPETVGRTVLCCGR